MVKSMTGFGKSELQGESFTCLCRVKSVNNRALQVSTRIEPLDDELELALRQQVQEAASRGSVDVAMKVGRERVAPDQVVFKEALFGALKSISEKTGAALSMDALLRVGVIEIGAEGERAPEEKQALLGCIKVALNEWNQSREAEGAQLAAQMLQMLAELERLLDDVRTRDRGRVESVTSKLRQRMLQILEGQTVSDERLLEEAAYLAQRSDITEELDRAQAHIVSFRELLSGTGAAIGRKMEFIVQEIQREMNTMGSKAQDVQISAIAVDAKVIVEKLKQQAANIE